jgi:predicted metal-dependent HD superfamily phosphohydrolase
LADEPLMIDIDLCIFGKPADRFGEYEAAIRAEYAWVALPVYQEKRAAILRAFMARESIFLTPVFNHLFESQARRNLTNALVKLQSFVQ